MHCDCSDGHLDSVIASFAGKPLELIRPIDISFITIQILNWDGLHLLKECLPTVHEAVRLHGDRTGAKHEVLVSTTAAATAASTISAEFSGSAVVASDRNTDFQSETTKSRTRAFGGRRVSNNDMAVRAGFSSAHCWSRSRIPMSSPLHRRCFFPIAARRRKETGKTKVRLNADSSGSGMTILL
jgi:hypothetical protein